MVGPVTNLQQRIRHLMSEWDDHPALQKIVDVIDMILSIPMNTPLAKVSFTSFFPIKNKIKVENVGN